MARYIDLEELAKRINKNIKAGTPEEKELIEWCKDECIRQGYAMPLADVVPKSEVEELKKAYLQYEETSGLKQAKQEVVREIFEEIYEDCFDQFGYIDYNALAELKKKYTDGENG